MTHKMHPCNTIEYELWKFRAIEHSKTINSAFFVNWHDDDGYFFIATFSTMKHQDFAIYGEWIAPFGEVIYPN